MVKPWDRFIAILTAIKTVIGLTLIPVLYPLLNRLADMGQTFARWMLLFPNIARVRRENLHAAHRVIDPTARDF